MADDAEPTPGKYDLRLSQSVEDIRSNVKWTLVAFGAIGTTLLAGSQLSSLGKFALDEPRLWAALAFAMLALGAASFAVRSAQKVANAGYVEFYDLHPTDVQYVQRNAALLDGFATVDNLRAWYDNCVTARHAGLTDPADQETIENNETWFNYLDGLVDTVVSYVRYNRIRQQSEQSRSRLTWASIVAAVALLGFAWAANPKADQPAIVVLKSPASEAALTLTELGKQTLAPILGADCVAHVPIAVIVLSVGGPESDVVSLKTKDCALARFTIKDTLGKLSASSP
jgi:hypothetical protein